LSSCECGPRQKLAFLDRAIGESRPQQSFTLHRESDATIEPCQPHRVLLSGWRAISELCVGRSRYTVLFLVGPLWVSFKIALNSEIELKSHEHREQQLTISLAVNKRGQ
jgi:hypothetical protein